MNNDTVIPENPIGIIGIGIMLMAYPGSTNSEMALGWIPR